MQMFDDLLYHLHSNTRLISKVLECQSYLGVTTFTTVVESGFFIGYVGYHGVSSIIHQDLGYFPIHILERKAFNGIKLWYNNEGNLSCPGLKML